jgi:hypothetical protein
VIVGRFGTPDLVHHGYVRTADGKFTTFDVPGAGTAAGLGTTPQNINLVGATAGYYQDSMGTFHGFVRSPSGVISPFDPPGSVYTLVCESRCINLAGAVTGFYLDAVGVLHGFLRSPVGKITVFDAPGADLTPGDYNGTFPGGINAEGSITGYTWDVNNLRHGFLRTPDGHFTVFDDPSVGTTPNTGQGTVPDTINALGVIAGNYLDANNYVHAFTRSPRGDFFTIDPPPPAQASSYAYSNNLLGAVTGFYWDENWGTHSFVWTPPCGGF